MRRALRIFIPLVAAVAAALWLMANPGRMAFEAAGYAIEAPLWLGAIVLVLLLGVVAIVARAGARMRGYFWRRRVLRAERRRADGDMAVVSALAALAAGDGAGALRDVTRAQRRLGTTPLTLLLAGHAARAVGDGPSAARSFDQLADIGPPGAFLGHRGLAALATEQGDREAAAAAGRAALAMRPDAPWARALVFDDAARQGNWRTALTLLPDAAKGTDEGRRRAALLLGAAAGESDAKASFRMIEEAVEYAPDLAPAHAARVIALRARGDARRAAQALERGMIAAAHPMLAALALEPQAREDAEAVARRAAGLAGYAPDSGEAQLMAAQAAREAELWPKARRLLDLAQNAGLSDRRVFMLRAEVAAAELGNTEAGRAEAELHLREAAAAPPAPSWWCSACGAQQATWQPVCPECGGVGTLHWGSAPPAGGAAPLALSAPVPGL